MAISVIILGMTFAVGRAPAVSNETPASDGQASPAPHFYIKRDASGISVSGQTSSVAHEAILRDTVANLGNSTKVSLDLQEAALTPPGWALVTELALRAALLTQFSDTSVTEGGISIRGVTSEAESFNKAVARLQIALLPGMQLEARVISVSSAVAFENLCRRQFDAILKNRALEFAVATSTIGPNAIALLDGLIETAADCPSATISVRANGDGPASVLANRLLGEARARSIVEYLTARGLYPSRIKVLPVADTAGTRARQVAFSVTFGSSAEPLTANTQASSTALP